MGGTLFGEKCEVGASCTCDTFVVVYAGNYVFVPFLLTWTACHFLKSIITNPLKKNNVSVCTFMCSGKSTERTICFTHTTHTHTAWKSTAIWLLIEKVRERVCDSSSLTIQLYNDYELMNSPVFFEKRNSLIYESVFQATFALILYEYHQRPGMKWKWKCNWLIATKHQRMAWMNTNQPADGGHS